MNIKKLRKDKRYSQKEFAQKVGITRQYLYLIEKGYCPSIEIICKIASVLEISPRTIFNICKGDKNGL